MDILQYIKDLAGPIPESVTTREPDRWQGYADLALRSGTAPLCFLRLPDPVRRSPAFVARDPLQAAYLATLAANTRTGLLLEEVEAALRRRGIPLLLLKGVALAWTVYPDPGGRAMNDVDLMVPAEAFPAAGETLAALGFRELPTPYPHQRDFRRDDWPYGIELHRDALLQPHPFRVAAEDWWAGTEPLAAPVPARGLGPEANLLYLLLHTGYQEKLGEAVLRKLVDCLLVARRPGFAWDRFWAGAERAEAEGLCGPLLGSLVAAGLLPSGAAPPPPEGGWRVRRAGALLAGAWGRLRAGALRPGAWGHRTRLAFLLPRSAWRGGHIAGRCLLFFLEVMVYSASRKLGL